MKKLFFLFATLCVYANSHASFIINPSEKKASEIYIPVGDRQISLLDLSVISIKDFQTLSKKHLSFFERISFKAAQKKIKNNINADGTVKNNRMMNTLQESAKSGGFDVNGFFLGLLLGLIGVIIAYAIKGETDVKKNRIRWAWAGFAAQIVIVLIILLVAIGHAFN